MTVIVESKSSPEHLSKFFQFCGDLKSISKVSNDTYEIQFINSLAEETALLLNNAELDGDKLKVYESKSSGSTGAAGATGIGATASSGTNIGATAASSNALPSYESSTGISSKELSDVKNDHSNLTTGDAAYDDINQESKPKYIIMAQLLSKGYQINDEIITNSISFDKKHGISDKFKKFVNDLDIRLGGLTEKKDVKETKETPANTDTSVSGVSTGTNVEPSGDKKLSEELTSQWNTNFEAFKKSKYYDKLAHYYDVFGTKFTQENEKFQDKAAQNEYGVKIHDFYKGLVDDVKKVHLEAKRLSEIKN